MFQAGEDPDLYVDTHIDDTMILETKLIRSPIIQKKDGEIVYHKYFTEDSRSQEVKTNSSPEPIEVQMEPVENVPR